MDLTYGSEMEAFRGEVTRFLSEHWPTQGEAAKLPRAEQTQLFREQAIAQGYLCRSIPKEYGGSEQAPDALRGQVIREEFAAARAPMEPRGIGTMMLVPTLLDRGEEWQKEKFVGPTIRGELTWCQGYSEPGSGSDLASLMTRGELDGDEWVINGQKIWTSGAQHADYMFCLVRTEPDAKKHAGISYLLIDMKSPGIDVRPLRQMTGEYEFCEVFLEDVRVPKENTVGERGRGWQVSRSTLKHERAFIGNTDFIRKTYDGLLLLAQSTAVRGRPAIKDPLIRERMVALEARLLAAEYHGARLLTMQARGEEPGIAALVPKHNTSQLMYDLSLFAMDVMGDGGAMASGEPRAPFMGMFVHAYMWAFGLLIGGGTANIQRNIIAERGLGLPRDVRTKR